MEDTATLLSLVAPFSIPRFHRETTLLQDVAILETEAILVLSQPSSSRHRHHQRGSRLVFRFIFSHAQFAVCTHAKYYAAFSVVLGRD